MSLKYAVETWWGLEDSGIVYANTQKKKIVGYRANPSEAIKCFNSHPVACEENTFCRRVVSSGRPRCIPNKDENVTANKWPERESMINSEADGRVFTLIAYADVKSKTDMRVASVMSNEETNTICVVFPIGHVKQINKLFPEASKLVGYVFGLAQDPRKTVILAGHSMGAVMAQVFALSMLHMSLEQKRPLHKNIYIVGSGGYLWMTPQQHVLLQTAYAGRMMQFCLGLVVADKLWVDAFIYKWNKKEYTDVELKGQEMMLLISEDGDKIDRVATIVPSKKEPSQDTYTLSNYIHEWNEYKPFIKQWIDDGEILISNSKTPLSKAMEDMYVSRSQSQSKSQSLSQSHSVSRSKSRSRSQSQIKSANKSRTKEATIKPIL